MTEETDNLGDLLDDYLEKVRSGSAPTPDAYADAHPEVADELRETLPLLLEMEQMGLSHDAQQPSDVPPPDFSGTDFRLMDKIGSGGMGVVYKALQVSLNRMVAVKILSPSRPVEDAALRRLENEARVIAQLYHPNIVKVHTAGHLGGTFFYAMELLQGTDLARNPPTEQRKIARVGLDAARALAYAHGCGVMHCDVKPSNLFLGSDGTLKIGDFGLALSTTECGNSTVSHDGTLRYMAPERLSQKPIDFASDQYSLGATLYEFLARKSLRHETDPARLYREIRQPHVQPPPDCDSDLSAIVMKCLSYDPADRYPSMSDLADDLERYLRKRPVHAANPSVVRRILLWTRRDPIRATACLFALVCAAGFMFSLMIGLVNTRRAMEHVRASARTANKALNTVFRHVAHQPPSPDDAKLLDELLPYYESLSTDAQVLDADRTTVYNTLVRCAFRIGKYELAEKFLRNLLEINGNDVNSLSRLASAIQRQGRRQEAENIWNDIATRYAGSGSTDDQVLAARALINVTDDPSSSNYRRAFDILRRVLSRDPSHTKARLEYARLIMEECPFVQDAPIPDVPSDAVVLFNGLVAGNPQHSYYAMLRVQAIYERFRRKLQGDEPINAELAKEAAANAEDLYARFATHPGVAFLVFRTRKAYLEHVRRDSSPLRHSREMGRFTEFCRSVFNSSEVPEDDKASILDAQLDDLSGHLDSPRLFFHRAQDIRAELDKFSGARAEEFEDRLRTLQAKVPDNPLPDLFHPRHSRRHRHRFHWRDEDDTP